MGRRAPALSMLLSCEQQFRGESGHSTEVKKPENQNRNCAAQINFMPGGLRGTWAASWALPPCPGAAVSTSRCQKCFQKVLEGAGGERLHPAHMRPRQRPGGPPGTCPSNGQPLGHPVPAVLWGRAGGRSPERRAVRATHRGQVTQ